jgi:hypothetical protein
MTDAPPSPVFVVISNILAIGIKHERLRPENIDGAFFS